MKYDTFQMKIFRDSLDVWGIENRNPELDLEEDKTDREGKNNSKRKKGRIFVYNLWRT